MELLRGAIIFLLVYALVSSFGLYWLAQKTERQQRYIEFIIQEFAKWRQSRCVKEK